MTNNDIQNELIALHKELIDISSKVKALDTRIGILVTKIDKACGNGFTKCELINPVIKSDLDNAIKYDIDKFIKWVTGDDSISKFKVDSQLELLKAKCKSKEEEYYNVKQLNEEARKDMSIIGFKDIPRRGSEPIYKPFEHTDSWNGNKRDIKDIMDEI